MSEIAITLLVLKTRQLEQFRLFYQALGIEFSEEKHGKEPVHFAGRAGDVVVEIYPLSEVSGVVDITTRLGFTVGSLDEVIRALEGVGTKVVTPPSKSAWGIRSVVQDPDGRSVELYEHDKRSP